MLLYSLVFSFFLFHSYFTGRPGYWAWVSCGRWTCSRGWWTGRACRVFVFFLKILVQRKMLKIKTINRRDPFGQQFLYFRFRITWQSYFGNWDGISRVYIFPEHQKYLIFCVSFVISFRRCVNVGESAILNFGKRLSPSEKLSQFLRHELGQTFPLTGLLCQYPQPIT